MTLAIVVTAALAGRLPLKPYPTRNTKQGSRDLSVTAIFLCVQSTNLGPQSAAQQAQSAGHRARRRWTAGHRPAHLGSGPQMLRQIKIHRAGRTAKQEKKKRPHSENATNAMLFVMVVGLSHFFLLSLTQPTRARHPCTDMSQAFPLRRGFQSVVNASFSAGVSSVIAKGSSLSSMIVASDISPSMNACG